MCANVLLAPGNEKTGRNADVAQLVERNLAKVEVAGSNPVVRSERDLSRKSAGQLSHLVEWPRGEATACKAVYTGSNPVSTSNTLKSWTIGAAVARFPDTEEVTGSIPVSSTSAMRRLVSAESAGPGRSRRFVRLRFACRGRGLRHPHPLGPSLRSARWGWAPRVRFRVGADVVPSIWLSPGWDEPSDGACLGDRYVCRALGRIPPSGAGEVSSGRAAVVQQAYTSCPSDGRRQGHVLVTDRRGFHAQ